MVVAALLRVFAPRDQPWWWWWGCFAPRDQPGGGGLLVAGFLPFIPKMGMATKPKSYPLRNANYRGIHLLKNHNEPLSLQMVLTTLLAHWLEVLHHNLE
jgi:hypothetical protein